MLIGGIMKSVKSFFFILFLFVPGLLASCQVEQAEQKKQNKEVFSLEELKERIAVEDESMIILDVRTDEELVGTLGKIDGCIHIHIDELKDRLSELEEYKDKEIAVICHSGVRSTRGTKLLKENGFNARNVIAGMKGFRESE